METSKIVINKKRMIINMEEIITLKQLSNVQNWLAKGVRIAFCLNEDAFITNKIDNKATQTLML